VTDSTAAASTATTWQPSESTLLYCFAPRFFSKPGTPIDPTAFGAIADVDGAALAVGLFVAAFANLERRGKIVINQVEYKRLIGRGKRLEYAAVAGIDLDGEPNPSIERILLRMKLKKGPTTPHGAVEAFFSKDMPDPWGFVGEFQLGCLQMANFIDVAFEKQPGGFLKAATSKRIITWHREQVLPLAGAAEKAWADYQVWRNSSPFAQEITEEVWAGIKRRREVEDNDDDGGDE